MYNQVLYDDGSYVLDGEYFMLMGDEGQDERTEALGSHEMATSLRELATRAAVLYKHIEDSPIVYELFLEEGWRRFVHEVGGVYPLQLEIELVEGQAEYPLPENFRHLKSPGVRLTATDTATRELVYKAEHDLRPKLPQDRTNGLPSYFYFAGSTRITIDPPPDTTYTTLVLTADGEAPDDLAEEMTVQLPLPSFLENGLIGYAVARIALTRGDGKLSAITMGDFTDAIALWRAARNDREYVQPMTHY